MAAIDVLSYGIHAAPGSGNAVWNAVVSGEDRDDFSSSYFEEEEPLFSMAEAVAIDAAWGYGNGPIQALFLGSSSDSYYERENSHVQKPELAKDLAAALGIERHFQFANACAASSSAIVAAMDAINSGWFDVVLAGGADEVTRSAIAGFKAVRILADRCLPFHPDRRGLMLSDGAAFLLLAREGIGTPVAKLEGAGMVSGADEMAGMTKDGVYRALKAALTEAGHPYLDFVIAHGTGTKVNDEAESEALTHLWDPGRDQWVASYKRWLGHPQGASGAIGVVLAIEALERGEMFPTTDLVDPFLSINPLVTTERFTHSMKTAAVLSHGTWGVYTALVLSGGSK